jgi:Cof subfamily protein (haloacid dehalogenase superfamily)
MAPRRYDALVLDIDGTLLDDTERVPERTFAALERARAAGMHLMLATGRSNGGVRPVLRELSLDTPAIVFNGAAVYCPREDRLLEAYTLDEAVVVRVLAHAGRTGLLPIVARADGQFARPGATPEERRVLESFRRLAAMSLDAIPTDLAIRMTLLSETHTDSLSLHAEVERIVDSPAYMTHFPLAAIASMRDSPVQVVDVQPVCQGKAEALRVLSQRFGIAPERVVCVGDADNDVHMLRGAGLGVAMGNATPGARAAARRVIGDNNSGALADLIAELFLA